nr:organic cation transporter protein-like isoform X2 [Dermacentor andersoni]
MSTIDDILLHLGPWHYPVLAFCFFRGFPAAYYAMSLSFTAPSLRHWCARPPQLANWTTERWLLEAVPPTHVNEKAMPSQCETYSIEVLVNGTISILNDSTVRCSSWEYDLGDNTNTMTNDFNLVCDRVWLRAASQSFYMAGIMIGNFIFSHMSDWYGRKRALVFMTPLPVLASVVMCLSTSFLMLNIGRFVASLGLGGILNTTYTMSMEVLSARHRALGSLISTGGWTTGLLTMTGLAWLFRDWMLFQGVITIAALGGAVNWFFIPESPRWLLAMGRYDEAREELEKAVRKNKVTGVSVEAIIKEFKDKISKDKLSSKPTFADLFRSRSIRITSCLLSSKSGRVPRQASRRGRCQLPSTQDRLHRPLRLRLHLLGGRHLRAGGCLVGADGERAVSQDGPDSGALRQRGPDVRALSDQAAHHGHGLHHHHEPRRGHTGALHQGAGRGVLPVGAQGGRHHGVRLPHPRVAPAARDVQGTAAGHATRHQEGQEEQEGKRPSGPVRRSRSAAIAVTKMQILKLSEQVSPCTQVKYNKNRKMQI